MNNTFINKLPVIWRLDHKKSYFKVYELVEKLNEDERKALLQDTKSFVEPTKISMKKIGKIVLLKSIVAPVLGFIALLFKGYNNPISLTLISMSVLVAVSSVSTILKHVKTRSHFIYNQLIIDSISDISNGKSKKEMAGLFNLLDELIDEID